MRNPYAPRNHVGVQRFAASRDAKEFLIGKIVEQAQRGGIALTDVERKMLYFSEAGWTLPDISVVNTVFDRDYNQSAYESKIASIVREIQASNVAERREDADAWAEALRMLRKEDHYLLVMIDQAGSARLTAGRLLKLGLITVIGCCAALVVLLITTRC